MTKLSTVLKIFTLMNLKLKKLTKRFRKMQEKKVKTKNRRKTFVWLKKGQKKLFFP
jgi:hypothetical protein